jgi:hypothetical protein
MNSLFSCVLAAFTKSRRSDRCKPRLPGSSACSPRHSVRLGVEALEARNLLSFNPIQIRHAYGFDRVGFEDSTHALVAGNGQGQTIAIIAAFDDPNIASNLATFDTQYGLPAPPSFTKVNQVGGTTYPAPSTGWASEIALDVEYAHAMAPGADILLVEATNNSTSNLNTAVQYAANHGATVVSMSYGSGEFAGETSMDSLYTHAGVTYLAATGDHGAPGLYQAYSPNVVAVGGTSLFLSGGSYSSESGWSGSGGGISLYEPQPSYQAGVVTQSTTRRTIPDLSFVANPDTGVIIYDTYGGGGFYPIGGTSASAPIMAGLTAVIDQGRSYLFGRPSYNGRDFLNALYHLPQSDLHDITSGTSTGTPQYSAGPGYDLVTGRGTPIVDRFVSGMIGAPVYNPLTGSLLVTGGGRGGADTITLSQNGGQLAIEIAADTPVAGSGIPADQTFTFDAGQYSSVTVSTSDGATTVNIQGSTPTVPVTLSAEAGANTLKGPDIANTWRITGTNAGTLNTTISFFGFQNLTGGSGANTFIVNNGAHVTGTIDGGGGNGTLVGPNTVTTWAITALNAGVLTSTGGATTFTGIQNLTGGSAANTFVFSDGAGVDGNIIGGGGANTLNYAAYSTTVIVDLQTNVATGVGGAAMNIQNVTGGTGGGAGIYNILVGNGGNLLIGGDGRRNLLIAGSSASTLIGGNDDDILIGGTTAYDTEAGLLSLQAIMNYWSTTADNYATRVANLTTGAGVPLLDATMVFNNGGGNTMMGNNGAIGELNLFYGLDPTMETTDYNSSAGELFINC